MDNKEIIWTLETFIIITWLTITVIASTICHLAVKKTRRIHKRSAKEN